MPALSNDDLKGRLIFNRKADGLFWRDETDYAALGFDFSSGNYLAQINIGLSWNSPALGNLTLYNNLQVTPPAVTPTQDLTVSNLTPLLAAIPKVTGENTPIRATYIVTIQVYINDNPGGGSTSYIAEKTFSYTYSFEDSSIVMCVESTVNCSQHAVQSKDRSNYSLLAIDVQRRHSLFPPEVSKKYKFVDENQDTLGYTDDVDTVVSGQWEHSLESDVTLRQVDGLEILYMVSFADSFKVTCDTTMERIKCCLDKVAKKYLALKKSNYTQAQIFKKDVIDDMVMCIALYQTSQMIGDEDSMTFWYDYIVLISGCKNCNCGGDAPKPLSAPGSQPGTAGSQVIVKSSSGNISVNIEVLPNQIVYDLDLSSNIQQLIQGYKQTEVISGSPNNVLTVILDNVLSTAIKNVYKVTYTGAVPLEINTFECQIRVQKNGGGSPYYNVSRGAVTKRGGLFNANDFVIIGENSPNLPTDYACIKITNFFIPSLSTAAPDFTVLAQLTRVNNSESLGDADNLVVRPHYQDGLAANGHVQGYVVLRFINPTNGQAYKLNQLDSLFTGPAYITLRITYPS